MAPRWTLPESTGRIACYGMHVKDSPPCSPRGRRHYPLIDLQFEGYYWSWFREDEAFKYDNDEARARYATILSGVNPATRRRIRINGPTYKKVIHPFLAGALGKHTVFDYIDRYKELRLVINEINKLKWDEVYLFKGQEYQVPAYVDGVHRENDCMGPLSNEVCTKCGKKKN